MERTPPSRRTVILVVIPIVAMVVANWAGDILTPTWVESHPALLIALNSRNRILALVTQNIDPAPFFIIASLRLLASDPLFYVLGYWYGDRALDWMEDRTQSYGNLLRQAESGFKYISYPLVFIAPNNLICALAGGAGMRPVVFFAINISGTIARLSLIWYLGDVFSNELGGVLDFIREYRWWLTGLSVAIVGVTVWRELKGGEGELTEALRVLDDPEDEAALVVDDADALTLEDARANLARAIAADEQAQTRGRLAGIGLGLTGVLTAWLLRRRFGAAPSGVRDRGWRRAPR